jgi:hypothetical protein
MEMCNLHESSANEVGLGATFQPLIFRDEQSGTKAATIFILQLSEGFLEATR